MELPSSKPKVSVCVVTYNQAGFIRECLQSLVDQKTNFFFEVIVGDDASTDNTGDIAQEFADAYPGLVKLIRHKTNVGPTRNYLAVHQMAMGDYVSHIDGDDCAMPGKLQAQADLLDQRMDISFTVHAVKVIDTDKKIERSKNFPIQGSLHDLLNLGTYFVHSSVMYRKCNEFVHDPAAGEIVDYFFHIERASWGDIYFDDRILGGYRIHEGGISKSLKDREMLEVCYENAFDRALSFGIDFAVVQSARLKRRMAFAISAFMMGEKGAYKRKVFLSDNDYPYATGKHRALHWSRSVPVLMQIYMRVRNAQSNRG
ncbi:glycosyltransferase family 2 protein [Massilia glaciei]|uniref:Glycosyl transferase n=1 Tax=Massilia glaciei TaxID=1524097 RepID=A0A2U2HN11_9BURK|nr:glycosyltransferase family 2 protein [Massilia glaciei]PWF48904.1 glycosyl transferase [Massilia glaciei]